MTRKAMIQFTALIKKFGNKGEKSGWTYFEVSVDQAQLLKPGTKKSFRVKGKIDGYNFNGIALLPMGDGSFIMALNAAIRKKINKQAGQKIQLILEVDEKKPEPLQELLDCLNDEPDAFHFYKSLALSHQIYFSKWIESAKTEATKTKRLTRAVIALAKKMSFSEMLQNGKNETDFFK